MKLLLATLVALPLFMKIHATEAQEPQKFMPARAGLSNIWDLPLTVSGESQEAWLRSMKLTAKDVVPMDEAIEFYLKRLDRAVDEPWIAEGYVLSLFLKDEPKTKAFEACNSMLEKGVRTSGMYFLSGVLHRWVGIATERREVIAKGIEHLKLACRKAPQEARPLRMLASYQNYLGDHKSAMESYAESIRLDPESFESHLGLGLQQSHFKQYQEACNSFSRSLELSPTSLGFRSRAIVLIDMDKFDEAMRDLVAANKMKPEALTYHIIGMIHGRRGDLDLAIKNFGVACTFEPPKAMYFRELTKAKAKRGDPPTESEQLLRKACIKSRWQDKRLTALLADWQKRTGDTAKAARRNED